jgi:hypothetical protein
MSKREARIYTEGKFLTADLDDPASIQEHELDVRRSRTATDDFFYVAGKKFDAHHKGFCWPVAAREELLAVITKRAALKKAYDDSMALVYQLSNKISRGEL